MVALTGQLREWRKMRTMQLSELLALLHMYGSDAVLAEIALDTDIYTHLGLSLKVEWIMARRQRLLYIGLRLRSEERRSAPGIDTALLQILRALVDAERSGFSSSCLASRSRVSYISTVKRVLRKMLRRGQSLPFSPAVWQNALQG